MSNSFRKQQCASPVADVSAVPGAGEHDVLRRVAEQVADRFAESGYAFVEADKVDGLAEALGRFLAVAGIAVNPPGTSRLPAAGAVGRRC